MTWKGFLLGFVIGLIIIPALGFLYFHFGLAPVATSAPPMPMERSLAHSALNAAIAVIKWKKLFGFYRDLDREHHSTYTIDGNMLLNEDKA